MAGPKRLSLRDCSKPRPRTTFRAVGQTPNAASGKRGPPGPPPLWAALWAHLQPLLHSLQSWTLRRANPLPASLVKLDKRSFAPPSSVHHSSSKSRLRSIPVPVVPCSRPGPGCGRSGTPSSPAHANVLKKGQGGPVCPTCSMALTPPITDGAVEQIILPCLVITKNHTKGNYCLICAPIADGDRSLCRLVFAEGSEIYLHNARNKGQSA